MGVSLGTPARLAWVPAMHFLTKQSGQGCILGQKVETFVTVGALQAAI